jgi:hypothetical protein
MARIVNDIGRKVVAITCHDERLGQVHVVLTDGESDWAEAESINTLRGLDANDCYISKELLLAEIKKKRLTAVNDEGKFTHYPTR